MSSETSENDNVDIGPVSGSRPVSSADPPNPAFNFDASLSRLEPPRHRLVPVEKVDGVRVERSEKVTVERAGIDGGGQSETVRIERTETVYDEQSDAVRIERSETVRVERIHTSQYDSLPSRLEESSSADVAQQTLDDSADADDAKLNGHKTSIPDHPPPPPQRPFPEPRQKAPVVKLESEQAEPDETIIEVQHHSAEEQFVTPEMEEQLASGDAERPSERIEVPDRVYEAVELNEEDPSPGAYRFKSGSQTSQRRPAFFVRGQSVRAPNHRTNGAAPPPDVAVTLDSAPERDVLPTPPDLDSRSEVIPPPVPDVVPPPDLEHRQDLKPPPDFKPKRNGADRLGIPRPKFRSENRAKMPHEQQGEHTGPIDMGGISAYSQSNGTDSSESKRVGENTGPIDLQEAASMPNYRDPIEPVAPKLTPLPNLAVPDQGQKPASSQPHTPLPPPPLLNTSLPSPTQMGVSHPAPPDLNTFQPPPLQLDTRQPEPPRFETPAGRSSNVDAADEVDPFDEYLEDPLGFFDPSEEIDVVDARRSRSEPSTTSTRQMKAPQRVMAPGQGLRANGYSYDVPESDYSSRVQPSASSRNGQRQMQRPAPRQRHQTQGSYPPEGYVEDDYVDDGPRSRPTNWTNKPTRNPQRRPQQQRRDPRNTQYDNDYRDDDSEYEDDYDDSENGSSQFPVADFLRSKAGTVLVGIVGLSIMGLSAMYVFSGQDAPEGEILESEGVFWWVDAEASTRSFIPESCADSLQSLGANKNPVPFADLETIPREDITSCEEIISSSS